MTQDENDDTKYEDAFKLAFRSGMVMGYLLTSIGLVVLYIMFLIYQSIIGLDTQDKSIKAMESLAG